jgi:hypothetical protein
MKSKTLTQPAIQTMAGVPSGGVDEVSPNASAIVGVTLMGDFDDVLAVLRTAVLLAKNMKAPLSLDLLGRDILPGNFDDTPYSKLVSELLDSARAQLGLLAASVFAMEVNVVAASFVSAGSITMRIRTANSVLGRQQA